MINFRKNYDLNSNLLYIYNVRKEIYQLKIINNEDKYHKVEHDLFLFKDSYILKLRIVMSKEVMEEFILTINRQNKIKITPYKRANPIYIYTYKFKENVLNL